MSKIEAQHVDFHYGSFHALKDINMSIKEHEVVAFIGPSGCGKSTFLRLFNRMNDLIPDTRLDGQITIDGQNIYDRSVNVDELRKNVGMVFQRPNPFPKSIYENVAYGLRVNGIKDEAFIAERVEESLRGAALWDEVKDKLKKSAYALSGGQQQRLCIARAMAAISAADGRAGVGTRPYIDGQSGRADTRNQKRLYHHHRDAQHAAGHASERQDGVLLSRPAD